MKSRLNWQQIDCLRCGAVRVVGAPCADCGQAPAPTEVNAAVVDRKKLVAKVDAKVAVLREANQPVSESHSLTSRLAQFLQDLGGLLEKGASARDADQLATSIWGFEQWRRSLEESIDLRPGVARRKAEISALRAFERLWPVYREALLTHSPLAAQRLTSQAQRIIDNAGDALAALAPIEASAAAMDRLDLPITDRISAALLALYPSLTLEDVIQAGSSAAPTTARQHVGPNAGLGFLLLDTVAHAYLNPTRLREKATATLRFCAESGRLAAVGSMADSRRQLAGVHRLVLEDMFAFRAAIADEKDVGAVVRRAGKLLAELYEESLPLLSWLRLLNGSSTDNEAFIKECQRNSTDIATKLQRGELASVFADAPTFLRNAPSHGRAFDLDSESGRVVINLNKVQSSFELADFVDKAYAFLETLLAALWGLEAALELAGIEVDMTEQDLAYIGLKPIALAALVLGHSRSASLAVLSCTDSGKVWEFEVDCLGDDVVLAALLTLRLAPHSVEQVIIRGSASPPLTVRLADFPDTEYPSTLDQMMALIEFKFRSRVADECALPRSDLRFMLAVAGKSALDGDLMSVGVLRRLRSIASSVGWGDEAATAVAAIATIRGEDQPDLRQQLAQLARQSPVPGFPKSDHVIAIR